MEVFQGKGVFPGVAFGIVHLLTKQRAIADSLVADTAAEWNRFLDAKKQADDQLEQLFYKTKNDIGEEEAMIVDVQRMMLEDGDFNDAVKASVLEDRHSAPYAVSRAGKQFSEFFASLDDEYMRARSTDVLDISQRLVNILLGQNTEMRFSRPVVLVAEDLTPSQTLQIDKSMLRAFIIRKGSSNSHTAILARTMNIPCIIQADVPLDERIHGKRMAVDGEQGICYLEPDETTEREMEKKQREEKEKRERFEKMRGQPTVTKDGRPIKLYANIGSPEDVDAALENDAEGVGLFRSEFLYIGRDDYPGEEDQFQSYRKVISKMAGKRVIIRTMDIGADKKVDYFHLDEEENPALGLRGVRISIERPELFKTQLRAIYRASAFGKAAIMFPMITSLWEVRRCKELAAEVRDELTAKGIEFSEVELGVMIETPAAVMIADLLAKEVDFFSVGTNDLTQYVLAVDRQNQKLEPFFDSRHPALMRMLQMVAQSACENGIWAGICGELAADAELTNVFLEMGFGELSVSPPYILEMRSRIREAHLSNLKSRAEI